MSTIFLSYARGDDEPFVRRLYEDLTAQGFDVWFDRVSMPSRQLTFFQEIRDAIAGIARTAGLSPDQSPCLALPAEAWDEPRLLCECPHCHEPLKFNPFIVDNRDRIKAIEQATEI